MEQKPASVAGDWTGVFDYGEGFDDAVPFTAMLFDVAGAIWGQTSEVNTFAPEADKTLTAAVSGSRSGREVLFTKTYDGPPLGGEFPVTYAGYLSSDGKRIEGRWRIPAFGDEKAGPFRMDRRPGEVVARAAQMRATEEIPV